MKRTQHDRIPLADLVAADPCAEIIEDCRERMGHILVRCPHDDGTDDHALHIHNPCDGLPAQAYCLSEDCKNVTTADFLLLLGIAARLH